MFQNAKELNDWCRRTITKLGQHPEFGSRTAVYHEIAERAGVSPSHIQQWWGGYKPNPTVMYIDKIHAALREIKQDLAA